MRLRMFAVFLACFWFAAAVAYTQACAQELSDAQLAELAPLNRQILSLYRAGKYQDALPLARRYEQEIQKAAPDTLYHATALNNLALCLQAADELTEAAELFRKSLAIELKVHGETAEAVPALSNLAGVLKDMSKLDEAEPLFRRALDILERSEPGKQTNYGSALINLAHILRLKSQFAEAEPLYRRALAAMEASGAEAKPEYAIALNNLAGVLKATNRFAEAEPMLKRALALDEKNLGPDHPNVAVRLVNLGELFQDTNRLGEAEPLLRRALSIDEQVYKPDHPRIAIDLNNIARLLEDMGRLAEAEPLMRRSLAINERSDPDSAGTATLLSNLAMLLKARHSPEAAEPLLRRALSIDEKIFGPDHPTVATDLSNLALLIKSAQRNEEAGTLLRRALAIDEKAFGPDHPDVAKDLNNLALLLKAEGKPGEGEPLMRRALAIDEKSYGLNHPAVTNALNNLASFLAERGDWAGAIALHARAEPMMTGAALAPGKLQKATVMQSGGELRTYARAIFHANPADPAALSKAFEIAQWALQNEAADALSSMAVRFAKGEGRLAALVREQQDALSARDKSYRRLDLAVAHGDAAWKEIARAQLADADAKLAQFEAQLATDFPDYAALSRPKPLSIAEAKMVLGKRQALVLFLDMPEIGNLPGETLVFAVTAGEARWLSLPWGSAEVQKDVRTLRCGLDASNWEDGARRERCAGLLGIKPASSALPPFDAAAAYALYRRLFSGIEDLTEGNALLIVPSGAMTQLPFEVLVTAKPDETLPRFEAYKSARWLGQSHAITVLPSAASLKALRTARASAATEPFIGFGNPLLTGVNNDDKRAWTKQACPASSAPSWTAMVSLATPATAVFRNGVPEVDDLRQQPPLPESADELCEAAHALGVPDASLGQAVYLGGRATVSQVKALSKSGDLARARVVHFATHGLLAVETESFAKNKPEPALLLTPPAADQASEDDNGLLTASEVAQLSLNADWAVMSACNTASGESENSEALSGLARAFFYAGARSLLVSHWSVNSRAAVAITTGAMNAMAAEPGIGRAEALRRSISAVIAKRGRFAHPSIWAPFVLVGSGER